MSRYVCIHGHFYQPPRENPWLESIEREDSAAPFRDWNERVCHECYRPNGRARRLDARGDLLAVVNNYARMSFNIGPTLLSWLEVHAPGAYATIVDADASSVERFGGHGSAMAQAYNHVIMPLASFRDRRTQVAWGIADFVHRFGRRPEGMWLPETAVSTDALEAMAEQGIRFTVLAPHQCAAVRPLAGGDGDDADWLDVGEGVDPSRAYTVRLPSGASIAVFFYDGPVSRAVAFEGLLESGERFARRLTDAIDSSRDHPQLIHIATDGESYGHHHRFGEMALADCLERLDADPGVELVNYARFLEVAPPEFEARIVENSSWSCAHGIERWRSDCGCSGGSHASWNQAWRGPLRGALDWLAGELARVFESAGGELFVDPWAARDAFIHVVLDRSATSVERFLSTHGVRRFSEAERVRALQLLEMQRHAMLMYSSCGWFFDDLSGIETIQLMRYAGRAIELAEHAVGEDLEPGFVDRLGEGHSNLPTEGDGRAIWRRRVMTSAVPLPSVAAHHVMHALLDDDATETRFPAYEVEATAVTRGRSGDARMVVGRIHVQSRMTEASELYGVAAVHLGDHIAHAGVRRHRGDGEFDLTASAIRQMFDNGQIAEIVRALDEAFDGSLWAIGDLIRDEQVWFLERVLAERTARIDAGVGRAFRRNAPLLRFLRSIDVAPSPSLRATAGQVLGIDLRGAFEADPPDARRLADAMAEADRIGISIDPAEHAPLIDTSLRRLGRRIFSEATRLEAMERALDLLPLLEALDPGIDLAELQVAVCRLRDLVRPERETLARTGDAVARSWLDVFDRLAGQLRVRLDVATSSAAAASPRM